MANDKGCLDHYAESRLLFAPGSSFGGAQPKASVRDRDVSLAIKTVTRKPVLSLPRLDRAPGRRIPFLSALSRWAAADHEAHNYVESAGMLRHNSGRA